MARPAPWLLCSEACATRRLTRLLATTVRHSGLLFQVSNALIKKELGVRLQFPTHREGLAAIAEGDMRPFN